MSDAVGPRTERSSDDRLHRLEMVAGTILYLSAINFILNALIILVAALT